MCAELTFQHTSTLTFEHLESITIEIDEQVFLINREAKNQHLEAVFFIRNDE